MSVSVYKTDYCEHPRSGKEPSDAVKNLDIRKMTVIEPGAIDQYHGLFVHNERFGMVHLLGAGLDSMADSQVTFTAGNIRELRQHRHVQ